MSSRLSAMVLAAAATLALPSVARAGQNDLFSALFDPQGQRPAANPAVAASPERSTLEIVAAPTGYAAGSMLVDTRDKFVYYVLGDGTAARYTVGVPRIGFEWSSKGMTVGRKAEWPVWTPPADMIKRRPELPKHMAGGPDNPLGARAMYLYSARRDSGFRIHGTNEASTIGQSVSSGCIRMLNADVIDLYKRVKVGTKVDVL